MPLPGQVVEASAHLLQRGSVLICFPGSILQLAPLFQCEVDINYRQLYERRSRVGFAYFSRTAKMMRGTHFSAVGGSIISWCFQHLLSPAMKLMLRGTMVATAYTTELLLSTVPCNSFGLVGPSQLHSHILLTICFRQFSTMQILGKSFRLILRKPTRCLLNLNCQSISA